ncbi:MAG: aminoglycoside phosphotransferase family protein [Actinomycetota bacterium]
MTLHDDEFLIDREIVADLIADQRPEWSGLPLRRLETSGTVNVAYRLGNDKLIRLPRTEAFQDGPLHESRWLPRLAPDLPLEVPEHLWLGRPTERYPSPWSVLRWIEGGDATPSALYDLDGAATRLAGFILDLRSIDTTGAPDSSSRGRGLAASDAAFRRYVDRFPAQGATSEIVGIWESCLAAPEWTGPPTWFHGDLHSGNLIARDGALVGVVDFEGCSVGDPASDLIAAWWLFDDDSRAAFRDVIDPDEAQWVRGKGWALYMAVAAIPYYGDSNPDFAAMAHRALAEILSD